MCISFLLHQLFILKNFKPADKVKEQFNDTPLHHFLPHLRYLSLHMCILSFLNHLNIHYSHHDPSPLMTPRGSPRSQSTLLPALPVRVTGGKFHATQSHWSGRLSIRPAPPRPRSHLRSPFVSGSRTQSRILHFIQLSEYCIASMDLPRAVMVSFVPVCTS